MALCADLLLMLCTGTDPAIVGSPLTKSLGDMLVIWVISWLFVKLYCSSTSSLRLQTSNNVCWDSRSESFRSLLQLRRRCRLNSRLFFHCTALINVFSGTFRHFVFGAYRPGPRLVRFQTAWRA
ncbi:uncharacterized protein LY89DRAFT_364119 [Mollisia scopiformis]|uniref:Secreted protein n=1 Tax=Mollisia scopiformis TaxID=149040 RepID=A0A132B5U1_MOLSC|nr:uncharacterized protein LY89DRAFT_364119 [Mollisia scopiformis]KUJ07359.1 hypothetical protein LY89DRAFT_364119 [Mollisia scopiformis]